MTFIEAFEKFREKLSDADTSALGDFVAIQINLTDDDCAGAFYIEYKDGVLAVEPYDYVDRSASITTTKANFSRILSGTMKLEKAVADSKAFVDGDMSKAVLVSTLVKKAKKTAVKKAAVKKVSAKKSGKESAKKVAVKAEPIQIKLDLKAENVKKAVSKKPASKKESK